MDLIEDIGPILGIVAFLGFAILALLIVLQAREVRRLREWAGRAPERSREADEASQAAAEASGEETGEREAARLGALRSRLGKSWGHRWDELDRRSPIDPRWFVAVLGAAVVALAVVTSGFGIIGGDGEDAAGERSGRNNDRRGAQEPEREPKTTVAVLNATQFEDPPVPAVSGMADVVASELVRPAGFRVITRADAPLGEETTAIMFEPGSEDGADELAAAVEEGLGNTEVLPMAGDIRDRADGADLALLVGQDDAEFGQAGDTAP